MEGFRRSGRLKCKGPVIEENTIEDAINVEEYLSEDENISQDEGIQNIIGTQVDNKDVGPSTSGSKNVKSEKKGKTAKKRKIEDTIGNDVDEKRNRKIKSPVKKNKGNGSATYMFQTRTSPMAFFNAMSQLSPIQKSCLQHLGFGKLLNFKVNSIPSKLGFYVVDNFDDKKMEIQLEQTSIEINMELIADVIGIINKGVDIMDVDIVKDEEMLKNWEEQFGTKKVTPNDMKHMIRKSRVADMNFKLNFIVLFTSLMGGVKTKGFCDLSVLDHINMSTDIANINWCSYIWRCLKKCKEGWKRNETNSFFLGPITLLAMLYVDGTVCKDFRIGRKRPPTTIWTSELLKERELAEIKTGGLGKAELAGPYVEEEDDPMPENLEGFMWKLNSYIECIKSERNGFVKTLAAAKMLYPGNALLADLEDRYIQSLRYQCEDNERTTGVHTDNQKKTSQSHEPSLEDVDNFDTPMYRMGQQTQLVVFETADKLYKDFEHRKMINNFEIPSFSLGLTQEAEMETGLNAAEYEMGPETQEEVIKSTEIAEQEMMGSGFKLYEQEIMCSADMEDNRGNAGKGPLDAVPLNYVSPVKEMMRRGKRVLTETERMKSPFYIRVVNADKDENSIEKKLSVYLFSKMAGNVSDVLFETKYGQKSSRGQIESLGPQEPVDNNVLSSWSAYLNFLEGKKDKNSPARLFLPVFEVDKKVMGDNDQTAKRFMVYVENAHSTYGGLTKLDKADIVFIPVSNNEHKFLLCFNMKNPAVSVIDSKKQVEKVATRKKKVQDMDDMTVASILHKHFGQYLSVLNHGKAAAISESQLVRGTFDWQTDKRVKDSGILVMRDMETYMGNELGKWKCGLDVEGKKQNTQLGRLRNKYAAKLLLSDCNIYKSKINEEMDMMKSEVFNVKSIKVPQRGK
ncbi:ulp1 protease family, C-terminal catalytic domain-containing protein [Tanacetum coccineum]|uniref:Ulp1 protease family, C-terminal catalytic domain-containing protein n=1 Tax=Tanacetum coccineum TaxID=301880 RepID=A0ABQ5DBM1_9ASTR